MKNQKASVPQPRQPFKDEKVELSEAQQNPGLADPKQFVVKSELSFTGQTEDDAKEKASISTPNVKPYSPLGKRNRPGVAVSE
jgi:hypothetical protein